jgi:Ca2+-binding EF-hand superfamily protein
LNIKKYNCFFSLEFAKVMGQTFYRKTTKNEMEQAFRYFDKDDSGFISVNYHFLCQDLT